MSAITNGLALWRRQGLRLVFPVLVVVAGWFILLSREPAAASPAIAARYQALQARLALAFPGCGLTDHLGHTSDDVPKGYAMILKAELWAMRDGRRAALVRNAERAFHPMQLLPLRHQGNWNSNTPMDAPDKLAPQRSV